MSDQNITTIIVGVFGLLTTIATSVAAYYMAKVQANTKESVKLAESAGAVMAEVHTAVNSNHQAIMAKVAEQDALLLEQNKEITALKVQQATTNERQTPTAADGSVKP